jgi:hypothetical protein
LRDRCELPAKIDDVADARIHAHRAGGGQLMHRVTRKEHTAF